MCVNYNARSPRKKVGGGSEKCVGCEPCKHETVDMGITLRVGGICSRAQVNKLGRPVEEPPERPPPRTAHPPSRAAQLPFVGLDPAR